MSTNAVPLNDLTARIRSKYPGAYDDMDDATLTKKILAKYPGYADLAAPKVQKPEAPQGLQPYRDPALESIGQLVGGTAKSLYQVSAPGIAASLAQKFAPNQAAKIPPALQGAAPEQLPDKIMTQGLLTLAGAAEGSRPFTPEEVAANRAEAAKPKLTPETKVPSTVTKFLLRRIPGLRTVSDLAELAQTAQDMLRGKEAAAPPAPPAPKPPVETAVTKLAPVWRDATRSNVPYAGETTPSAEAPKPAMAAEALTPRAIRVLPKESPNFGQGPRLMSGESALNHMGTYLGKEDLVRLAQKRGIPQAEIDDLLSQGKTVKGSGPNGELTGADVIANLKTEVPTQKLWNAIQETYTPQELEKIASKANTFWQGGQIQAKGLGYGTKVMQKTVKSKFFPELVQ